MSDPSMLPEGALPSPPRKIKAQILALIDTHCHVHVKPEQDQRQSRHPVTISTPVSCACASADMPPPHVMVSSDQKIPNPDMDTDDRHHSDTKAPSLSMSAEQQQKCEEDGGTSRGIDISVTHVTMGIREDDWLRAIAYANTTNSRKGGGGGGAGGDDDDCGGSDGSVGSGGSGVTGYRIKQQPGKGVEAEQINEQVANEAHGPPGVSPLVVVDPTEEALLMDSRIGFRFGIGLHPWYVVRSIN